MKIRAILEWDNEVKRWAAYCPELPGCTSAGDTEEEAITNISEAIDLWFEPSPVPMNNRKLVELTIA